MPVQDWRGSRKHEEKSTERRGEHRAPALGHLWMMDNRSGAVIRCRCIDMSDAGMRLRAPVGFGIHEGQTYELCSHLPGQCAPPGLGLVISRRATVSWSEIVIDGRDDFVDVGVTLESNRRLHS